MSLSVLARKTRAKQNATIKNSKCGFSSRGNIKKQGYCNNTGCCNKSNNDISIDKDNNGQIIEWKHFLRQILWIPHKDNGDFSFHRLMQIALNYGQLLGSLDVISNKRIKTKIDEEGIYLMDITKYITQENLSKIQLTEEYVNSIIENLIENLKEHENSINITQTENITTDVIDTEDLNEDNSVTQMSDTSNILTSEIPLNGGGHKRYYINYL